MRVIGGPGVSKVRFILLAESHVFTDEYDSQVRIIRSLLPPRWRKLPDTYVRLVYCLGYGENNLLTRNLGNVNSATRQYWDVFGRLAGTGCQPRGGARVYDSRLEWKFRTLTQLRDRGIWLLDSSLHALVARGGKRDSDAVARELHCVWWNEYGKWLIQACRPKRVWAIGKGIHRVLLDLGVPLHNWIYQPQAGRSVSPAELERRMKLMCSDARGVCKG